MCGITGYVDMSRTQTAEQLEANVERMTSCLRHRGPDSGGIWVDARAGIALGHRRLAILDLSPAGQQPMVSANSRYVITYNGEVYNHQTIRKELAALGHRFLGTSDTEVMLQAFSEWGVEASLKKFVGMFAFGLWDSVSSKLYLVRDRMGEKPLYYGWSGNVFLFGSELKALRAHPQWRNEINRDVLTLFFRYNYIPAPYSIYKGIFKLPPGTFLSLEINDLKPGSLTDPMHYWSLQRVAEEGTRHQFSGTETEAIAELNLLLKEAVSGQMVADVPLGAFLSGGVDSSTVVALMQAQSTKPVKTFAIGFHDIAYNEVEYARAVAKHLGTDHTELYVTPEQAMDIIPYLPSLYDEPFADSSQIPTYLLAKLTRKYVTVSLSGDGGDEVFCGYNRHVQLSRIWRIIKNVPKPLRRSLATLLCVPPASWSDTILRQKKTGVLADQVQKLSSILGMDDPEQMYLRLTYFWEKPASLVLNSSEPCTILSERDRWPALPSFLDRLLYLESATSLPDDMLVKVDRASMGVSLEMRVPLLDHRIVEFSWRLPLSMKLRNGVGKWVLRQLLYQYVPQTLIERPKAGFGMPIDVWLKGPLRDWAEGFLNEDRLEREGYLNPDIVKSHWVEHLKGRRKWQQHLWGILMFQAWLESQKNGTQ